MNQNGPENPGTPNNPLNLPKDKKGPGDIGNETGGGVKGGHVDIPPRARNRNPINLPTVDKPPTPSPN